MSYASEVGLEKDERIQMQLLVALSQLMDNSDRNAASGSVKGYYVEVQKMSLETLNKLLQTSGHSLTYGWAMIFDMIKSVVCVGPGHLEGSSVTGEEEISNRSSVEVGAQFRASSKRRWDSFVFAFPLH